MVFEFDMEVIQEYCRLFGLGRPNVGNAMFWFFFIWIMYSRFPTLFSVGIVGLITLTGSLLSLREDCSICCENRCKLFIVVNSCGHKCCRLCLRRYLESGLNELISRLRRARRYTIRCYGGCEALLGDSMSSIIDAIRIASNSCLFGRLDNQLAFEGTTSSGGHRTSFLMLHL
jgi:hypothetical protein